MVFCYGSLNSLIPKESPHKREKFVYSLEHTTEFQCLEAIFPYLSHIYTFMHHKHTSHSMSRADPVNLTPAWQWEPVLR